MIGGNKMISCTDLRTGMTILHENNIYSVLEYQHVKSARSAAFVRLKLRNLRSGNIVDLTVNSSEKFEPAHIEKVSMQYLYNSDDFYVFMNNETYEQIEIPINNLEHEANFFMKVKLKLLCLIMSYWCRIQIKLHYKSLNVNQQLGDTAQNALNTNITNGLVIKSFICGKWRKCSCFYFCGKYQSRESD